jgi:hypothetical protein
MSQLFSLQDIPDFPYTTYMDQIDHYSNLEKWYNGSILEEYSRDLLSNKQVALYPLKINPLKGTAERHAAALFGQTLDSIRYGSLPVRIMADVTEDEKESGKVVEEALRKIYMDSGGGSLFISNGILSQYLGGCVFAASWLPLENRIEVWAPSPDEFIGFSDGVNYWNLREAWIVRKISMNDAKAYEVAGTLDFSYTDYYYVEHWTKTNYKVMLNGLTVMVNGVPQEGNHPFGVVPLVYIPHIRTKTFLGNSMITEMVKGIVKEINLRWADIGDAVNDDSHQPVAIRNVRGNVTIKNIDGRPMLDLGSTSGIAGGESNPDMFTVSLKTASDVMLKLCSELYELYRREANHPAIADGEDEGSQRSSLTLSTRMWPLVSHVEMERVFWTVGITKFSQILLKMMAIKGLNDITQEYIDIPLIVSWASMMPLDRNALVNEVGIRAKYKLGSQEHLMSLFGDIFDLEAEEKKIEEEQKANMVKFQPQNQSPFGQSPKQSPNENDEEKGVSP